VELAGFHRGQFKHSQGHGWSLLISTVLLMALATPAVHGQSYMIKTYSVDDGMPSPEVYALAQDHTGRMWFASRLGPVVYDGVDWQLFPEPMRSIRAEMLCDHHGVIWLAREAPVQVSRYQNGSWSLLPDLMLSGKPRLTTLAATQGADGQTMILVGTEEHGAFLWQDQQWQHFGPEQGLSAGMVRDAAGWNGRFFLVCERGLFSVVDGKLDGSLGERVPVGSGDLVAVSVPKAEPGTVQAEPDLWVLTTNSLLRLVGGSFSVVGDGFEIPAGSANGHHLVLDLPYAAYFSHESGPLRLDLRTHQIDFNLSRSVLGPLAMLIDRERNLWIASIRGANKLVSLRFANYNSSHGLLENEISALCEPRPGVIVFGHNTGLSLFEDGKYRNLPFTPFNSPRQVVRRRVMDLTADGRGGTWIAASELGLGHLSPAGELTWIAPVNTPRGRLFAVIEGPPGKLLVGGDQLVSFDGERLTPFISWNEKRDGIIRRMLRRRNGDILVVSSRGVLRLDEDRLITIQNPDEPGASNTYTAYEDSHDRVWVGSRAGLLVLNNQRLVRPDQDQLRLTSPVYLIIEDPASGLWFGTDRGVVNWSDGKARHFGANRGFAGHETNRAAGLVASNGELWLGTERGVSRYRWSLDQPNLQPPMVELDRVMVGEKSHAFSSPLRLGNRDSSIELHFLGISLSDERAVRYRYFLEGHDKGWSSELPDQPRSVRYSELPPGEYRFHLTAANDDGVWSEPFSSPPIVILQPIWQRPWFLILIAAAATAVGLAVTRTISRWRYAARLEAEVRQRREAEKALLEARDAAESANQAKSQFLANMSHEIRTPMHAVIGMSSLLADTRLDAAQQGYLETIKSSAESLLLVISDILDFSKIDAGKLELESVGFDLGEILESAVQAMQEQAHKRGLTCDMEIASQTPVKLQGDPGRLRQIINNLIANAIKFTEQGGVLLMVYQVPESNPPLLRFSVTDTGIGIPADKRDSLFMPFFQVDASTTRRFGGTGLGLSIAKQLAEAMGGEIGVKSQAGNGSTFWFTARFTVSTEDEAEAPEPESPTKDSRSPSLPNARVLVVEDNLVNQKLAQMLLENMGYQVSISNNGLEAIEALESSTFDLVLMDVQMPVMDGLEATRRIRDNSSKVRNPSIPIVAMTAFAMKYDREKCLDAGMDDYLAKPVQPDTLRQTIARWIDSG
jgi:signal transduction histidine kinase/CheY-like chemotaxis protein/ligand-binding sensor domain-containing protein